MVTNIRDHEDGILVRCDLRLELLPLIYFIDLVIKEDTQGFDDYLTHELARWATMPL